MIPVLKTSCGPESPSHTIANVWGIRIIIVGQEAIAGAFIPYERPSFTSPIDQFNISYERDD